MAAEGVAQEKVQLARIAEAAERYPDMCKFLKDVVEAKLGASEQLNLEERNLLSVAYKNVVGAKRSAWRTLSQGNFADTDEKLVTDYKSTVEKELEVTSLEVLGLLKKLLETVPEATSEESAETSVFYLKMCGDYYRYLSEFSSEDSYKEECQKYYTQAMEAAKGHMPETHPTRLGLALNFSVCYYEILKKPDEARQLAKEAFDAAIEKLDTLNDASYKDSTLIMQLLRDNLTLWTSEAPEEENEN